MKYTGLIVRKPENPLLFPFRNSIILICFMQNFNTVDLEMFERAQFSLILGNSLPSEFKVLAYIDLLISKLNFSLKIFENDL